MTLQALWLSFIILFYFGPSYGGEAPLNLPKLEVGVAGGLFELPDYPSSDQSRSRSLGLPFLIYRGEFLRSDQEGGLRGRFLKSELLEFDLSFGAAFPANSENNYARFGMPDLDWMGEIGPRANFHLHKAPWGRVNLLLPVRYVFSTNFKKFKNFNSRGLVFNPELKFRFFLSKEYQWALGLSSELIWATETLHDYFFEVDTEFETNTRKAYQAQGGYLGAKHGLSLSKAFGRNVFIFFGATVSDYGGTQNQASPLYRKQINESYFLGLAWVLYKSKVQALEEKEIPTLPE